MWADRLSPERLGVLAAELHSILPAPRHGPAQTTALQVNPSLEEAAGLLRYMPGFVYLNGSDGARLLRAPLLTFSYSAGSCSVSGQGGELTLRAPAFDILDAVFAAYLTPSNGALLAGFLSYDLANELEDLGPAPKPDFVFPQFQLGLYDSALTLDDSGWSLTSINAWREAMSVNDAENLLSQAADNTAAARPIAAGEITSRPDRAAFEASVERIVARIRQGDIFQTNLCRRLEAELETGREWDLFQRLRNVNPAQYEAFIKLDNGADEGAALLSISPEMFLKVHAGVVQSKPIKGTRPRGATSQTDRTLAHELQTSEKDRAELAMIVDVTRNDLGRVCETGSVKVLEHASLMTLPTVHHLYSTVEGRLHENKSLVDLLRAAFPAASITGAPKIEAMRVAMREEAQLRGPSMGAIGWMNGDSLELSVGIRTAFTSSGRVRYYAGCGITADSVASDEFAESAHKAAAFVRAIQD